MGWPGSDYGEIVIFIMPWEIEMKETGRENCGPKMAVGAYTEVWWPN